MKRARPNAKQVVPGTCWQSGSRFRELFAPPSLAVRQQSNSNSDLFAEPAYLGSLSPCLLAEFSGNDAVLGACDSASEHELLSDANALKSFRGVSDQVHGLLARDGGAS